MSKVDNLLEECNKQISIFNYFGIYTYIKLFVLSLTNNFKKIQDGIFDDFNNSKLDEYELIQFIEICENRLDRLKVHLNEVASLFGFDLIAISIIVTLVEIDTKDPVRSLIILGIFVIILLILLFLVGYYRSQIHAWTAFKEKAILMKKNPKPVAGLNLSRQPSQV